MQRVKAADKELTVLGSVQLGGRVGLGAGAEQVESEQLEGRE